MRASRGSRESVGDQKRKKMGLTGDHDKVLELVVYAILQTRKDFLAKLTTARNEARKILFKEVLFLVEKMSGYENLAAAKADGYWIEFVSVGAPSDLNAAQIAPDQLWQIDLCERVAVTDNEGDKANKYKRNRVKFEEMAKKFPFLSVVLHWRKHATNPVSALREYLPMSESWSMHKIAADCLLAAYKYEDFDEFLSLSDLSLRALHLHAVGFYAMLRRFCGHDLCAVEESCLGHLTWKDLPSYVDGIDLSSALPSRTHGVTTNPVRGAGNRMFDASGIQEARATCMYGGGTNMENDNEERPSLLATYRKEHFEFPSWNDFVNEKRSREAARHTEEAAAVSVQSGFNLRGSGEMDLGDDFDWPGQSGREV